jgi:hypothetical protein
MEHIEEAGIHSGDSACSLPPYSCRDDLAEIAPDRGDGLGAEGRRPDERAVRHQGRRRLRAGGQSARLAAPCRSSPRRPASRSPRSRARVMAGEALKSLGLQEGPHRPPCRGQGGGVPVRPLPRRRHHPRPGDEVDRRGHGPRPQLRRAFAKAQLGAGSDLPRSGHVPSSRSRTATSPAPSSSPAAGRTRLRASWPPAAPPRSPARARASPCSEVNKVLRGPAAHRRHDQERRDRAHRQHHRGQARRCANRTGSAARRCSGAGSRTTRRWRRRSRPARLWIARRGRREPAAGPAPRDRGGGSRA